jgi:hypothetical protein
MEAEDYPYQKCGAVYGAPGDEQPYQTIFQWDLDGVGTVTTVTNTSQLIAAITAAKSDGNIKGVHLEPGTYAWGTKRLTGLYRDPGDAFFIRTTPGSLTQAIVQDIYEDTGEYAGIAFVDLEIDGQIRLIGPFPGSPTAFVAEDILVERCHVWVDVQGQRVSGVITPGKGSKNIQIRLNTMVDHWAAPASNHAHAMFAQHFDGMLLEGNVIDHNGWDPAFGRDRDPALGGPTPLKHNVYFARPYDNCVIRFNWNSRASSHGWHTKQGGHVYRNIISCCPIAMQLGFGADGMFGLYGVVEAPEFRDNVVINADNITQGAPVNDQPRGQASWWTCVHNALFDRNIMIFDRTSATNSATLWLERVFEIHGTVSNNLSYSWNNNVVLAGNPVNFTPDITYVNNAWNTGTISPAAEALAFQLGATPTGDTAEPVHADVMAWIDAYKADRRRLGVDIEELKGWMATISAGVSLDPVVFAAAVLTGGATLSLDGELVHEAAAVLTGSSSLTATAEEDPGVVLTSATLTGEATLEADAEAIRFASATLVGGATLIGTAADIGVVAASATLVGGSTLVATVVAVREISTELAGGSTIAMNVQQDPWRGTPRSLTI